MDYHSFSWSLLFIFGGCYILIPDQWIWTQEKLAKVMGKEKVEEKEAKLDELGWQITSSHVVQYICIYTYDDGDDGDDGDDDDDDEICIHAHM